MKLSMISDKGKKIAFPIPKKFVLFFLKKQLQKHSSPLSKDLNHLELEKSFNLLKSYKGLVLFEASSKDGSVIKIIA